MVYELIHTVQRFNTSIMPDNDLRSRGEPALLRRSVRRQDGLMSHCQLVGILQFGGVSVGMLSDAVPDGTSKNVARSTVTVFVPLYAVCTSCP